MAAVNSIISQADYNLIRNKIVNVMGTGSADYGWGQAARIKSSAVADGTKVTINEWASLRYDIINAWNHITNSSPTTAQLTDGQLIRYATNFTPDTGTLDVPVYQYNVWADNIVSNRFTVASGQYATSTPSLPSSSSTAWTAQQSCTIDFYWADANEARYFFNSGGQIRVASSFTRRSGVNTAQNIAWESLLSTAGTQVFAGSYPGSGVTPNDGQNWYRLNSSFQQYYSIASSSPYGANTYKLYARVTDVPSNSSGTSKAAQIRVLFTDGYTDPGTVQQPGEPAARNPADFPPGDVVDGTLTVSVALLYATGVMVPVGTGNFTVTTPTVSIGGIA